jgi:PBP1b-binding outer membrane lipoprotein LpoB
MKRLVLIVGLAMALFLSGCVAQQQQLEQTRAMLKEAKQQEAALLVQAQGDSLTAVEANAVQTSLDRTRALVKNLEQQEKILMDQIQEATGHWADVATQVLGGILGIGALAGRKP